MIVLVGSSVGGWPLYSEFLKSAKPISVIGHNAQQTVASISNRFIEVDYNDIDYCIDAINDLVSGHGNFELFPGAHDFCYRVYIEYMVRFGLKDETLLDVSDCLHNKQRFRNKLAFVAPEHSVNVWPLSDEDVVSKLKFPVLYKPEHAGGGRGIKIFKKKSELLLDFQNLKTEDSAGFLEEFVFGEHISVSVWIRNGRLISFHSEKELIDTDLFRVTSSYSSNHFLKRIQSLKIPNNLVDILIEFGFQDGFCHAQIILDSNGGWRIVECCLRLPGDLYSFMSQTFGNFNYAHQYIESFRNAGVVDFGKKHAIFPDNDYYVRQISNDYGTVSDFFSTQNAFSSISEDQYFIGFKKAKTEPFLTSFD